MASLKTYLVPVDFSKTSGRALNYAIKLARDTEGRLLLVHVITDSPAYVPVNLRAKVYTDLKETAQRKIENLMRRKTHANKMEYRILVVEDDNPARFISDQARKSRVSMIVMGSQGRTGFERLFLGSVAEKTVRYAQCPVLIVKR